MGWPDCVVVYMDLPSLRKLAEAPSSDASTRMRQFHDLVRRELGSRHLQSLDHAYVWNDSALLLALVDGTSTQDRECLQDAERLKRSVDMWIQAWSKKPSYAIAVKGQVFPPQGGTRSGGAGRVTVLRTSSYAMGNCFLIEEAARRNRLQHSWYLDDRLARHIPRLQPSGFLPVKLMRRLKECKVWLVDGYLWNARS